jgi:hypothetical protein
MEEHTLPTTPSSESTHQTLLISSIRHNARFPTLKIHIQDSNEHPYTVDALLDSGASSIYISSSFVNQHSIPSKRLPYPMFAYNADDTRNKATITHHANLTMTIQGHKSNTWAYVTELGAKTMIVGMTWLQEHNPVINWITGQIAFTRCPTSCGGSIQTIKNLARLVEFSVATDSSPGYLQEIRHEINSTKENVSTRLAIEDLKNTKTLTIEDIRKGPFADYADVFEDAGYQEVPPHRPWDHAIDLVPNWESKQWKPRIYPLTYDEQKELDVFLQENLENGRIRKSISKLASPVFFVKKKDGTKRLVIDYRRLNDITEKNRYPLPLTDELVTKWKGCVYFTTLDIRSGYYNVRIKEGDEWKTAFITNRGLYESIVMTFGLVNAPATFQNMMNDIFIVQIRRGDTDAYIDDIGIGTTPDSSGKLSNEEFHIKAIREVLQLCREHRLFLKPSKCLFLQPQMKFLGFIINGESISMDPTKIAGVKDWPTPTNLKELRSFIGFINFYRRFLNDFSTIARPLNDLTKKDVPFIWSPICNEAFEKLKKLVTSAPVLSLPDMERPYLLETDASNYAYGAILSQKQKDDRWHPVAFMSKSMTPAERNYDVHDKELLAVVRALEEWRQFLMGAKHTTEVLTDHQNLLYFRQAQNLNRRQARWAMFLENFNILLRHRPGNQSSKPDALSRRADHDIGKEDNQGVTVLPDQMFKETINNTEIRFSFREQLVREQARDPIIAEFNTTRESDKLPPGWTRHEDYWSFWTKIYIPPPLRQTIFRIFHSSPTAGHPGRDATLELIKRDYYWPNLRSDIEEWIKNCDICQRTKIIRRKPHGELKPVDPSPDPWKVLTTDLIVKLPPCQGFDSIWTVTDKGTRMIHIAPTNETLDSEGAHKLYMDRVWKLHGTPEKLISDRGPQFASRFSKSMNDNLGIETALSTAYHPQTDGQSERTNQEVEQVLRTVISWHQDDWVDWLPLVEFALNNRFKKALGTTPFYANYGYHPQIGSLPKISSPIVSVENFVKHIHQVQKDTKLALIQAAEDMKRFYDRNRRASPEFSVGQKVLLDNADLRLNRPSRKLSERRSGPFEILERIGTHAYKLKLPSTWKTVHPVFHLSKLEPYHEDPSHPNHTQPPPDILEGEPEWEVEKILDSRLSGHNKLYFQVKWKGWSDSEISWEPEENLENSPELIKEFYQVKPGAPRRVYTSQTDPKPRKKARKRNRIREIQHQSSIFHPIGTQTDVTSWPQTGKMSRDATF